MYFDDESNGSNDAKSCSNMSESSSVPSSTSSSSSQEGFFSELRRDSEATNASMLSSSPCNLSSEEDESSSSSTVASSATSASVAVASTAAAAAQQPRRRKKKKRLCESTSSASFKDIYYLTGEILGEGSYGRVETCINMFTDTEYAVKIISKANWCFSRSKVLKEVELFYLCQGQKDIIQLIEYFEEPEFFYLIFEKAYGGPLLNQIQRRVHFTEEEAVSIIRDLATALRFLHDRGIAHRDLKPENILCVEANSPRVIKLCDFDLCSSVTQTVSTPLLQSPVGSAEYMAPEVVNAFASLDNYDYDDEDDEDELTYDKKCDLWSLGIIAYILLCGYLPFSGHCDDECGWEKGEECIKCQRSLFAAIKSGDLVFPDAHWATVSSEAKDLISKLLVKEASQRIDAASVLAHPWIQNGGSSSNRLETPAVLRRQTSVKEFSDFATNALAIKRTFEINPAFAERLMRRSATTQDFNNVTAAMHASPRRKTSAHAQMTSPVASKPVLGMKRQTSMVFVANNINHYNRCEV